MIIDVHAHTNVSNLGNFKAGLTGSRAFTSGRYNQPDEPLGAASENHVKNTMDKVGADIQFLSPRPF